MIGTTPEAIVIGASAGAIDALSIILPALPERYSLPVMVVIHMPPDKHSVLAGIFQKKCRIRVAEAEDKEPISAGTVYFAPPNYHLLVETKKSLSLSSDEPVLYSRPSIDVLFESAADAYGPALVAVIMTGANEDGAKGMKAVVEAGGTALVQHPADAYAAAMPMAAMAACPNAGVMSLEGIADYLQNLDKVRSS